MGRKGKVGKVVLDGVKYILCEVIVGGVIEVLMLCMYCALHYTNV